MGPRLRWVLLLVKDDLRLVRYSLSLDTSRPQLTMELKKGREKEGIVAFSSCPSGLVTRAYWPLYRLRLEMIFPSPELTIGDLSGNEDPGGAKCSTRGTRGVSGPKRPSAHIDIRHVQL